MESDPEIRYAVILPFRRNHIQRIFHGRDVICKFVGRRRVKIGEGSQLLFYASGGGREIVGEATIKTTEYLSPDDAIGKHGKRLFLSPKELLAYKGNRIGQSNLLVLGLEDLKKFKRVVRLGKALTMAGQTLNIEEYSKIVMNDEHYE